MIKHANDPLPLAELGALGGQLVDALRKRGQPVVITRHGEPAAVLMSPEDFHQLTEEARFLTAVTKGMADSEMGRLVSDEDLARELDAEFMAESR